MSFYLRNSALDSLRVDVAESWRNFSSEFDKRLEVAEMLQEHLLKEVEALKLRQEAAASPRLALGNEDGMTRTNIARVSFCFEYEEFPEIGVI